MKVKISDLKGAALDWAVEKALDSKHAKPWMPDAYEGYGSGPVYVVRPFSSDWAQGGPIIDALRKSTTVMLVSNPETCQASIINGSFATTAYGDTPLTALLRGFLAYKLRRRDEPGEYVEIPDELLKETT